MLPVCPACGSEIPIDEMDIDKGMVIGCPECGVDLLVLSVSPIDLEIVPEEESEWGEF